MRGRLEDLRLTGELVAHDLRSRVAGSGLGPLWHALRPLGLLLIYTFVFSNVLRVRPTGAYLGMPYWRWFLAGMAPWLLLQEALARAPVLVGEYGVLARQGRLSPGQVAAIGLGSAWVTHAIWLGVLLPQSALDGRLSLPGLAFAAAELLLLAWALNEGVAVLGAFLRDLELGIGLALSGIYFATPVVYPAESLPAGFSWLAHGNPIAWVVESYRCALLGGPWPGAGIQAWRLAVLLLLLGLVRLFSRRVAPALKDLR